MSSKLSANSQLKGLIKHFNFIKKSSHQKVNGVWKIETNKSGPVLGITIHTHGNEPSGLAVLSHFREKFPLEQHLKTGTVIFVLNNISATEMFLTAKNIEEKNNSRFVDVNMNRLPNNVLKCARNDNRYEIRRAQELRGIWKQFDVGLDIHSTTQKSDGMIVNIGAIRPDLIRGFPITDIITNIEKIQIGKPAVSFYGNGSIPVMVIETGSHESSQSFTRAINCTDALLKNLQMIEGKTKVNNRKYHEYFVGGSLMFPDSSYALVKPFETYAKFTAGEKLATNGQSDILAPFTGYSIFAPQGISVKNINEEVMFFLHPPKTIVIK